MLLTIGNSIGRRALIALLGLVLMALLNGKIMAKPERGFSFEIDRQDGCLTLYYGEIKLLTDLRVILGGRSEYWRHSEQLGAKLAFREEGLVFLKPTLVEANSINAKFRFGDRVNLVLSATANIDECAIYLELDALNIEIEEMRIVASSTFTSGMVLASGFHSWDARKPQMIEDLQSGEAIESFGFILLGNRFLITFSGNHLGVNSFRLFKDGHFEASCNFGAKAFGSIPREELGLRIFAGTGPPKLLENFASNIGVALTRNVGMGWCSWYFYYERVREEDVLKNAEIVAKYFKALGAEYIQLDDGYQLANGDWETNDKFPHGHRWLTGRIHSLGLKAGLWIAPFIVAEKSTVFKEHSDWLLKDSTGQLVKYINMPHWGGQTYIIDPSHPQVQDWLRELARKITEDWGYDYIKIDFLHIVSTYGRNFYANVTPIEAYLQGLRSIREGAANAYILACGAPLLPSVGLVDGARIGGDVWAGWDGIEPAILSTSSRFFMNGKLFWTDPDCLLVREPLRFDEARLWASFYAVTGQMNLMSDDLTGLNQERLVILQKTFPVVVPSRLEPVLSLPAKVRMAPALVTSDGNPFELTSNWKLFYGDGEFADWAYDDSGWTEVQMPHRWDSDYDGFGWYRVRFTLPQEFRGKDLTLELGRVDDSDETFINGVSIGKSGEFPPNYESAWPIFRRYPVPKELLKVGENLLAVRVYDGGGAGGIYNLDPSIHGFEIWRRFERDDSGDGAVLIMNLQEKPRTFTYSLEKPYLAFDFWKENFLGKVTSLTLRLKPHECAVIWLREPCGSPMLLGTSSHLMGSVDWKSDANTISGSIRMADYLEPVRLYLYVPWNFRIAYAEGGLRRLGELAILTLAEAQHNFRVVFTAK